MDSAKEKINTAVEKSAELSTYLKSYIDAQLLLKRAELSDRMAGMISRSIKVFIGLIFGLFIMMFLLVALGFYFTELLDSAVYGFLAVAGVALVIYLIILLLQRPLIINPTRRNVNNAVLKGEQVNEELLMREIDQLQGLITDSYQEIPTALKSLNAKDLIPTKISTLSNNFLAKTGFTLLTSYLSKNGKKKKKSKSKKGFFGKWFK